MLCNDYLPVLYFGYCTLENCLISEFIRFFRSSKMVDKKTTVAIPGLSVLSVSQWRHRWRELLCLRPQSRPCNNKTFTILPCNNKTFSERNFHNLAPATTKLSRKGTLTVILTCNQKLIENSLGWELNLTFVIASN